MGLPSSDEHAQLGRVEQRLRALASAAQAFAEATTDHDRLMSVVAQRLAESVADACGLHVLSAEGDRLQRVAVGARDRRVLDAPGIELSAPLVLAEHPHLRRVIETGEPLMVPVVDPAFVRAGSPGMLPIQASTGLHSLMVLPLRTRGRSLGILTLVRYDAAAPSFDADDLETARALADHAALAIENARAFVDRTVAREALARTEAQLRQAQKMDAVGRLAAGIAHDFNNLLSVILGYGAMMVEELPEASPMHGDLGEVMRAARRAADLTRQLLMFSRLQIIEPRILDATELLGEMRKLLARLVGEDIELTVLTPPPGQAIVRADPAGIEQVIMNLVVNARQAMPTGGKLTIEVGGVDFDAEMAAQHVGIKPGRHVMIAVTDDGVGMDKATQARIFEPFFTTKPIGQGTGLGLSTVFGIVQQSGGGVWVYSEPGRGATFKVYLPRVNDALAAPLVPTPMRSLAGIETVLLVEDEEQVRTLAATILRRHGYRVLVPADVDEATRMAAAEPIDLLVTDVIMPKISGPELAARLVAEWPDLKVLYMSGYTDDSVVRHGVLRAEMAYVQKPITPLSLARKVREVLDGEVSLTADLPVR